MGVRDFAAAKTSQTPKGLEQDALWGVGFCQFWLFSGFGFGVQGLGFRVQGLGFRVQGLGFRFRV